MADISTDAWTWSSTASSDSPSGSTAVGTGLAPNLRAIQAGVKAFMEPLSSVTGTNTITATCTGASAYVTGQRFWFVPANSNTGAANINITALGAKNIFLNAAALVGYEMRKNQPVEIYYDGTQFNIIGGAHGDGIPIGSESNRYFATAPSGHLLCDGSAVSRTTYADLFAVLSTTWGVGDNSTTFNLPSMARRAAVGSGGSSTGTLGNTVGSTGGEETHTLLQAELPASTATIPTQTINLGTGGGSGVNFKVVGSGDTTGALGSGTAFNQMQPSAVVYKAIKF